jgi:arsenate reductase-like glutaredoxin family protein
MARQRIYKNQAERQAAYRERNAHRMPPLQSELAALARSLRSAVNDAAKAGDELAKQVQAKREDEVLRELVTYFRNHATSIKRAAK